MATSRPTLDQGPPLPPQLAPQQANVQQLAGGGGQQNAQSGSASLQQQVIQKLMLIEQLLTDIGTMLPGASGIAQQAIDTIRKGMGAVLAQGAQPPAAPGGQAALMAGPQQQSVPGGG